ncbi:MAG: FecR domain-containing protein [Methylacidiphilales bacterium]|nr:FecR domain-containing protein [Candidatus Methylacidiphilales bacterium]
MKLKSAIWVLFLILGASGIVLHAETVAATVDKVSGNVYATDSSGKSKRIKAGDIIATGSLVHANADSSALLKLMPGATTVVTPGTDVVISSLEYSQSASGVKTRKIRLTLKEGKLLCHLAKHDGNSDFRVATPMGTSKAIGTDWVISFTPSAGVSVETVDGVVRITLPNGKIVLVPGGQVTTSPDGVTIVTGKLSQGEIAEIVAALGGGSNGGGGGGTFTINPVDSNNSNPANTSSNETVSPNGSTGAPPAPPAPPGPPGPT